MEDILLLEDNQCHQENIRNQIPEGLTHRLITNSRELEQYLADGGEAKLYFLDDEVPEFPGREVNFHFIKNCSHLLERRPDAKVFYIGDEPWSKEQTYCREKNIPLINRKEIGDVIRRELSE